MRSTLLGCAIMAATICPNSGATAQEDSYIGIAVGRVEVSVPAEEGFQKGLSGETSLFFGRTFGRLHGVELRVGYLQEEQTDQSWSPSAGEAPHTIGVQAYPVEISYMLNLPLHSSLLPYVAVGPDWIPLSDRYQSDTPVESQRSSIVGGHLFGGVKARLGKTIWVSVRGGYRGFLENSGRYRLAMELDGWGIGMALALGL